MLQIGMISSSSHDLLRKDTWASGFYSHYHSNCWNSENIKHKDPLTRNINRRTWILILLFWKMKKTKGKIHFKLTLLSNDSELIILINLSWPYNTSKQEWLRGTDWNGEKDIGREERRQGNKWCNSIQRRPDKRNL